MLTCSYICGRAPIEMNLRYSILYSLFKKIKNIFFYYFHKTIISGILVATKLILVELDFFLSHILLIATFNLTLITKFVKVNLWVLYVNNQFMFHDKLDSNYGSHHGASILLWHYPFLLKKNFFLYWQKNHLS